MQAIAIIGNGRIGGIIAPFARSAGYPVRLSAGPGTNLQIVEGAGIIVLAVPWTRLDAVAEQCAPVLGGKILIDATNPYSEVYEPVGPTVPYTSGGVQNAARAPDSAGRYPQPIPPASSLKCQKPRQHDRIREFTLSTIGPEECPAERRRDRLGGLECGVAFVLRRRMERTIARRELRNDNAESCAHSRTVRHLSSPATACPSAA